MKEDVVRSLLDFTNLEKAPQFEDTTWIKDFGLDSLGLFHFLLHVEKTFELTFSEGDFVITGLESFDSLVDLVERRMADA